MKGLTLIELLIVLAIVSILATLAYPSYQEHLYKTRRTDAHIALLTLAGAMEIYFQQHHTYLGAESPQKLGVEECSSQGYYQISLNTPSAQTYSLSATPDPHQAQALDPCKTLTLNHRNEKGGALPNCW
jgi:type IV pilus assembly protein PilE